MSDEIEVRRLTVDEIAVLREIVKWRRNHDVDFWRAHGNLGRFAQWSEVGRDGRQVSIDFLRGDDGLYAEMTIGRKREFGGMKVNDRWTVAQGIDVLVSLGYLPPRFSSAYRAGWDASALWHDPKVDEKGEAFRRTFHDPHNIGFPALEPTW
jgi:hypothetical protein